MKRPRLEDATKEEFVEFFRKDLFGQQGAFQFERFLSDKRYKVVEDKLQNVLDLMEDANKRMYEYSEQALNETDKQKKMELYIKACECQEEWDKLNKKSDKLTKELDEFLEIGDFVRKEKP